MSYSPFSDAPAIPQPSAPTTNLSAHVDGGQTARGAVGSNASMPSSDKTVLHYACGIVLVSLMSLWLMGALVFSSARL